MNNELKNFLISTYNVEKHTTKEWEEIQMLHNVRFPSDYIEFIDCYGLGAIDDFLWIYSPWSNNKYLNFFKSGKSALEAYEACKNEFPNEFPFLSYPKLEGLLPFGATDNGDNFYWLNTSENPDLWKIIIYKDRSEEYLEYNLSLTEFLVSFFKGKVQCDILPEEWQEETQIMFTPYIEE
ncbi:SMI1/KNR4 family protein [Selenomonas ruminantium]|uniref:SMI1 / KNR4 family (SUKH-1) n=1 Tax=Selenomonas ruminantium TaxID=971 RepID=A0A1H0V7W8_SELRU|nr:SMI1/KNR4 family protein [Selenomonas ruminantium]SDP74497.1 SMI1 / KNR4 family (SUKH-1) [Selenomonas ruminantium]